jgi:hypothetical protein
LRYSFDRFHRHDYTIGVRIKSQKTPKHLSQLEKKLWHPTHRYIAPLKVNTQRRVDNKHYIFIGATQFPETEESDPCKRYTTATFENPSPYLNDQHLRKLRKKANSQSLMILAHGGVNYCLREGENGYFKLMAEEQLIGMPALMEEKYASSELLKFFGIQAQPDIKNQPDVSILYKYSLLLDGRPLMRGILELSDHCKVEGIAILPPFSPYPCDKSNNVRRYFISNIEEKCYSRAGIFLDPKDDIGNLIRASEITIQNVVIIGDPLNEAEIHYDKGIEIYRCDSVKIETVYLNRVFKAIQLAHCHTIKAPKFYYNDNPTTYLALRESLKHKSAFSNTRKGIPDNTNRIYPKSLHPPNKKSYKENGQLQTVSDTEDCHRGPKLIRRIPIKLS